MTTEQEQAQAALSLALVRDTQLGDRDTVVPPTFPYEVAPRIWWLGNCLVAHPPTGEVHTGVWAHLVIGEEKVLLFDTGLPQGWRKFSAQLDAVLGDRQIDYVMPSHPEFPHSGNLPALLDKYPGATAVGDMRDYHLHYPEHADRLHTKREGDEIDLGGGYRIRVVEAVLRDMPNTLWAYEVSQRVLFVADGFAYLHRPEGSLADGDVDVDTHSPGDCGRISGVGDSFPSLADILHYCSMAFYWSRFRNDSDINFDRLQALLESNPTSILAPSHGNVTLDLDRVVSLARAAHRQAYRGAAGA